MHSITLKVQRIALNLAHKSTVFILVNMILIKDQNGEYSMYLSSEKKTENMCLM